MFTGLVETLGTVSAVRDVAPGRTLVVAAPDFKGNAAIGDSIAINGCCLTVVVIDGECLEFQAGQETLSRTNLGQLRSRSQVNLERSLQLGDRLGGHLVTGHIDGLGRLQSRNDDGDWSELRIEAPPNLCLQMASKGSIAVDGVSLTLVDVEDARFSVALIPHTLFSTTLGALQPGDAVNLETDLIAKYVSRLIDPRWLRTIDG